MGDKEEEMTITIPIWICWVLGILGSIILAAVVIALCCIVVLGWILVKYGGFRRIGKGIDRGDIRI